LYSAIETVNNETNIYCWTGVEVEDALNKAIHKCDQAITIEDLFFQQNFTVYLGKFNPSGNDYRSYGICFDGVWFSMDNSIWKQLEEDHNMWILNAIFLQFCINRQCNFGLCTTPSLYFNQLANEIVAGQEKVSYAKELKFIYSRYYHWNDTDALPIMSLCPTRL